MSKTRYFQKRTWKFGIARKHRQKWMFDKFAKPFVYGYVPHRKPSKIRACQQYCLKSKELRLLQPVTFPLLYVMLPLSVAHRSKLAVLCQLAFIHFSPNMASCRSKESSVRWCEPNPELFLIFSAVCTCPSWWTVSSVGRWCHISAMNWRMHLLTRAGKKNSTVVMKLLSTEELEKTLPQSEAGVCWHLKAFSQKPSTLMNCMFSICQWHR